MADNAVMRRRTFIILFCVGVLFASWRAGAFDHALAPVGMAAHECAQNGFGATYCGDELHAYRRQVVEPVERAQRVAEAVEREQAAAAEAADAEDRGWCLDGSREGPEGCARP